jgi:WD domain, G-beta repeat
VGTVAWSPTHPDFLATGGNDLILRIYDLGRQQRVLTLTGHSAPLRSAAWAPDGTLLASASNDGTARIWDLARGAEIYRCSQHGGQVVGVAWSPDGQFIASSSDDTTVRIWRAPLAATSDNAPLATLRIPLVWSSWMRSDGRGATPPSWSIGPRRSPADPISFAFPFTSLPTPERDCYYECGNILALFSLFSLVESDGRT